MSGGTQKTKTENKPWAGVEPAMSNAANQLTWTYENAFNNLPSSPYTQWANGALAGQVNNQGSLLNQSLGLASKTVNGDFLSAGNPYFQQMYNKATAPVIEQWQNQIAPGIDAQFAAGGRMGSGLYANARGTAEGTLADSLADTAGAMAYQNYSDERARQNAAMTTAPSLATLPGGILQQIGEQQKAENPYAQKFNLAQQYAQSASALNGGLGTQTTKAPGQNPWLQALGLGLQGASMFI